MSEFVNGILYILNTNFLMEGLLGAMIVAAISLAVTRKANEIGLVMLPASLIVNFALHIQVATIFIFASVIMFVVALASTEMGDIIKSRAISESDRAKAYAKKMGMGATAQKKVWEEYAIQTGKILPKPTKKK